MSKSFRVKLIGLGYLIAWRLTRIVPDSVADRAFMWAARRSYRKNPRRRAIVAENFRPLVAPEELEATVRGAFDSYARYWKETFRLQDLSDAEVNRRMGFEGDEILDKVHATGHGGVLAVPHVGNWDSGGRYVAKRWGLTAVVEVLRPRALFDRFVEYRQSNGLRIIPLVKGGDVTTQCLAALDKGDFLALLCDRDLSGSGVPVTMFGRQTKLAPGPAVVALRSGAPLIPGCIFQEPGGNWTTRAQEPIETAGMAYTPENVAKVMQEVARRFERFILIAPEQWHAFSRMWID